MKAWLLTWQILLLWAGALWADIPAQLDARHVWNVVSPDHEQTFAYGMEQDRKWTTRGPSRQLALLLNYTNDPYVDRDNPREYDNFTFHFPNVTLGTDGRTFLYRTPEGRMLPVAQKRPDFFGISEINLLPNAYLEIKKPHGYLTITLIVQDHPSMVDQ